MKTKQILTVLFAAFTIVPLKAADDFSWNVAGPADWNNPANWANINVGTGNNDRFVNNGGIATVTANTVLPIRDIKIGMGGGTSGTVNNFTGTHATGAGNWAFVGVDGGNGTYNLADTSAGGGTYTGYAQGSGTLTAVRLYLGTNGGTGFLNVNTTGAAAFDNDLTIGENGTGTVNFDGGTISNGGWTIVGKGGTGNGTWRMSGGIHNGPDVFIGVDNGTGNYTVSGGTLNVSAVRLADNDGWQGQGGTGNMTISGGVINSANQFQVGRWGAKGFVTQTGGTVHVNGGWFGIANDHANSAGSSYALSGGSLNLNNGVSAEIGADAAGSMTVSGTGILNGSGTVHVGFRNNGIGTLTVSDNGEVNAVNGVSVATNGGSTGTVNGNGGTIYAPTISHGAGVAQFNANGVTFKARSNQGEFLPGFSAATTEIQAGGLKVDSNGFAVATGVGLDGVGGVTKEGAGTLSLTGATTFSGATTINGGTLEAGATNSLGGTNNVTINTGGTLLLSGAGTDRINDAATVTMAGGTIAFNGNITEASSPGTGALTLSADSVIDFANGNSIINFGDSFLATWTAGTLLKIYNWDGLQVTGGGDDQLLFGSNILSLTPAQRSQIWFYSGFNTGLIGPAIYASSLNGEVVPVPEPSTIAAAFCLLGLGAAARSRRRPIAPATA